MSAGSWLYQLFCFAYQFYDATKIDSTEWLKFKLKFITCIEILSVVFSFVHKVLPVIAVIHCTGTLQRSRCMCRLCVCMFFLWSKSRTEASRDPRFSSMAINWLNLIIQSTDKIMLVRFECKGNLHRMFSPIRRSIQLWNWVQFMYQILGERR